MLELLTCPLCKTIYDLKEREPKILNPCGHTICYTCYQEFYIPNNPQDQTRVPCKLSHSFVQQVTGCLDNLQIVNFLQIYQSIPITCLKHQDTFKDPGNLIEKQILVCIDCILEDAINKRILDRMQFQSLTQQTLLNTSNDQHQQTSRISIQESKMASNSFGFPPINPQEGSIFQLGYSKTRQSKISLKQIDQRFSNIESIIQKKKLQLLDEWIDKKYKRCSLLYKASRDGFTADKFHSLCDDQGPTLSLVTSQHGLVFGGFTTLSWKDKNPSKENRQNSFIFSLTHETKHQHTERKCLHSLKYSNLPSSLITFGYDLLDISIGENCNNSVNTAFFIGYSYALPQGFQYGTVSTNNYLAGHPNALVDEIEVYKLME